MKYPIGNFQRPTEITAELRGWWIEEIASAPGRLRDAVRGLSPEQLDTPYRDGGWTVRQVVHHVADSHVNSYVRFRLALTEENPAIKPYNEAAWAELADARTAPVKLSLDLLDHIHQRWVLLLRSLTPEQWVRTFHHPEMGDLSLEVSAALYAWHGKHHEAHITSLRNRLGWVARPMGVA
jgi:uncharacterized damage-inducible protein DinB